MQVKWLHLRAVFLNYIDLVWCETTYILPKVSQKMVVDIVVKYGMICLATNLCFSLVFSQVRLLPLIEISTLLFCNLVSC